MAAWRAALAAGVRAPLRGRLAGLRPPRSQRRPPSWRVATAAALLGGGSLAACYSARPVVFPTVLAQKEDVINEERDERLFLRKHRFMHFASLEYEGEYYMTPRDFLFSVMFDQVERLVRCVTSCCPSINTVMNVNESEERIQCKAAMDGKMSSPLSLAETSAGAVGGFGEPRGSSQ